MLGDIHLYVDAVCEMFVSGRSRTVSGYIYSIVCISAAVGIVCIIAPDGIRGGIRKHLKLVCSLCLLCVLIGPLLGFINSIKDVISQGKDALTNFISDEELRDGYESIYDKYLEGDYGDNVGKAVKNSIREQFGIPESECRVNVEFADEDGDGVKEPSKITVIFSGRSVFRDPKEIKSFVSELFGCECICAVD